MKASGNQLIISSKPNYLDPYNWFNFIHTSFRVFLPANVSTNTQTPNGHIKLVNLEGNHTFSTWGGRLSMQGSKGNLKGKTLGGKIDIINCEADILATTMGGNINLAQNKGQIEVNTKGGNLSINQHRGQLKFNTWGGNIYVADLQGQLECSTWGGNIKLSNVSGNIGVSTRGGNISADVPFVKEYAWFDTTGGNIETFLPLNTGLNLEVKATRIYHAGLASFDGLMDQRTISGKLNGGGPSITIKTGGGKINLGNNTAPVAQYEDFATSTQQQSQPSNYAESVPNFNFFEEQKSFKKSLVPPDKPSYLSDFNSFLFAAVFCLLLVYGLNSVVFFSLEFLDTDNLLAGPINKGIFLSNITNSMGALFSIYVFLYWLEPLIRTNWAKYLGLAVFTFGVIGILQVLVGIFYWSRLDAESMAQASSKNDVFYSLIPLAVTAAYFYYWQHSRQITRKITEQEYQLLNLEKLKSKAQLDALEARINPHFLYNSLNSIAGLIFENPDKAEEMTIQLSKLFRYTTGRSNESYHTITDELEIIKAYLAIEQVRFGDRLTYTINAENEVLNHKIPRFLLQPLIENAIKHGIAKITKDGQITLKIELIASQIKISIYDNGPAFDEHLGGGFGMRSIREKLQIVYGQHAIFEVQNQPQKVVTLILPII
jgi:sensor histidine kinase YesM